MPPSAAQIYDIAPPAAFDITNDDLLPVPPAAAPAVAAAAPRYEGLALVRMVAAFFVTLNHTTYAGLKNAPQDVSNFVAMVNDMGWRVPFFLLLSGFLFARSTQDKSAEKLQGQCSKSARRVLVLLLGWSALYLLNPPLKPLLQWDVPAIIQHYSSFIKTSWPNMLWEGPAYHLWFLVSMTMVWLFLGWLGRMWPGLRGLVNDRTAKPLLCSTLVMLVSGTVAWHMPSKPASAAGQLLEVLVVHLVFPCSFVLVGAALWQRRHWLTKPVLIAAMLVLGTLLMMSEPILGLRLDGPGPRSLGLGGLCLAVAALGLGMRLPAKPLSKLWSLSPGIYCAHFLVINRLEPLFVGMQHWSSTLVLACAAFVVSLGLCYVLSRFEWSRRFVQ